MRSIACFESQEIFTVGDLRKALENLPDDIPILVEHVDSILRPIVFVRKDETIVERVDEDVLCLICSKWGRSE